MTIVTDTHVHLYPCYDLRTALRNLVDNLGSLAVRDGVWPRLYRISGKVDGLTPSEHVVRTAFLVESHDCNYFSNMLQGRAGIQGEEFEVKPAVEDNVLVLYKNGEPSLYFFAGRQIVTAERIEILALTVDIRIEDGLPANEVIEVILNAGGIPVLSWAPGKWFFKRGKIVQELIESLSPGQLLIGDTTLRPTVWAEPLLMKLARKRGFAIVAGSDPLPFSGEEKHMGTYASVLDGQFDPDKPVTSVRKMLTAPGTRRARVGKRCGLFRVIRRLKRNMAAKYG